MAVAFASIFMATTEKENTHTKLHVRYMYIHLLEYRFFFGQKNHTKTKPKKVLQPFVTRKQQQTIKAYQTTGPNSKKTLNLPITCNLKFTTVV